MAKKKNPPNHKIGKARKFVNDDSYLAYFEEARDAAQQKIWTSN